MTTTKTIYETGATSHAVNDLILFTDNTRELSERRDYIYNKYANPNPLERKLRNPIGTMKTEFIDVLLHYAMNLYISEFPGYDDHKHIKNLTPDQKWEFAQLYYNDFTDWKQEHGIK